MKEKLSLKIIGMHCMGCALGLEEELEKLDFIENVEVDLNAKVANIEYIKEKLDINKIKEVVESLNFKIED